ncbi:hypothetical protein SLEP1_g44904 [Rubroshorea leprosula]|uniref:Reverse transcriptase zinc-binding domain-containing protein n=1 Tax=Rubroshorea leprosula TaxID=152421 RepID=A0AAV5LIW7_9ROSI|nr:hypothetical protein SLEP1_g44904 [Rubroshorea leprosula]
MLKMACSDSYPLCMDYGLRKWLSDTEILQAERFLLEVAENAIFFLSRPRKAGGRGVKDLRKFNLALLGKWWWRLLNEGDTLWNKVVMSEKYKAGRLSWVGFSAVSDSSRWWKDLWRLDNGVEEMESWFRTGIVREVGEGNDTLFWGRYMVWMGKRINGVRPWVFGGGVEHTMSCPQSNARGIPRGIKLLWNKTVPLKVAAFAWKVLQERIPTVDNLAKRGLHKEREEGLCVLCGVVPETKKHLLFTCKMAWEIWAACYEWWGIKVVSQENGWMHLEQHAGLFQRKTTRKIWVVIWFTVVWSIWLWRNHTIFKQQMEPQSKVMEMIKFQSFSWVKAKLVPDLSMDDWYTFPSQICI